MAKIIILDKLKINGKMIGSKWLLDRRKLVKTSIDHKNIKINQ